MEKEAQEPVKNDTEAKVETDPKKPTLSSADLKALFDKIKEVDDQEYELSTKFDVLKEKKAAIVKSIMDGAGAGPFEYGGGSFTIRKRGEGFYLRQEKPRVAIKVE